MSNKKQTPKDKQTSGQRLRVLISAYACEPGKGSEPGVGWNWTTRLVEHCELWVITRANNRKAIEFEPAARRINWIYVDGPAWVLKFKRGRLGVWLYYRLWQWLAFREARKLLERQRIDVVHHLTFGAYWAPTDMFRLGIPLVVGPVGGGERVPWRCIFSRMSLRGVVYESQRNLAILLRCASPVHRHAIKQVNLFVTKNRETLAVLSRMGAHVAGIHSEAAISGSELDAFGQIARSPHSFAAPFRILCIGELRALKGGHFVIEALGRLKNEVDRPFECVFLGEGLERKRLEKLAARYRVEKQVQFSGRIPRNEVFAYLRNADVLLHPTLHDSGGWTCLEAMAASVPVVSLDIGGPAMQLDSECGVLIPPMTGSQIVDDIRSQLIHLMGDPVMVATKGAAARKRVEDHYLWDQVVTDFLKFYRMALES